MGTYAWQRCEQSDSLPLPSSACLLNCVLSLVALAESWIIFCCVEPLPGKMDKDFPLIKGDGCTLMFPGTQEIIGPGGSGLTSRV
jgi:hypothetical protein